MPQEIVRQGNFNGGELDPDLVGRRDTKAYFAGLAKADNLLPIPQGPIMRRPGLAFVARLRGPIAAIDLTEATLTAPAGGEVADLAPDAETAFETTDPLGAAEQVVLEIEFAEPVELSCVDLIDYAVKPPSGVEEVPPPPPAPITYPWDPIFLGHINIF